MTFLEHLGELRDRLVRIAAALLAGFMLSFAFKEELFVFVAGPMKDALAVAGIYTFRAIEITETIFVYVKLSIVSAFFLTLPYTFYQLWSFIAPGLLEKEKQAITPLVFFSTVFFLLGSFFAYRVIIPFIAQYLAEMTLHNPAVQMDVTVQSAFGFSLLMMLLFGGAFQLPLLMFFLSLLGLVTAQKYLKFFRFFVVISFVLSALLTPPDPISQLLMAVPLNVLYLLGVVASLLNGERASGARSITIPSNVWGVLSIALVILGIGLGAGTWWLGDVKSPLRWIPNDAVSVLSIHSDALIGPNAPPDRKAILKARLDLPEGIPAYKTAIVALGPSDEKLTILTAGCENSPSLALGRCQGKDLLIGDDGWLNESEEDGSSILSISAVKELTTGAPGWYWERPPTDQLNQLIPNYDPAITKGDHITISGSFVGDEPWLEVAIGLEEKGDITSLQNRVDLWRAKSARRKALAASNKAHNARLTEILTLLEETVAVSDAGAKLMDSQAVDKTALKLINERYGKLKSKLSEKRAALMQDNPPSDVKPQNLLDQLDGTGIKSWRTLTRDNEMVLRVDLTAPAGIEMALEVVFQGKSPEPSNEKSEQAK